jgi:diacylglycerol kinase (ATP)
MKNSFLCAFRGFYACVRTERNLRFHLAVTFYVVMGGLIVRLAAQEWAAVLLCIGAVLGAELLNTAIETLCDAVHPDRSLAIGLVKDITAGAVLMFAVVAAAVGAVVFFNADKLECVLAFARENTVWAILLILTVPLALYLIFRSYKNDKNSRNYNRRTSQRR